MRKFLLMMACAVMLSACGGSSKPQPTEESKTLPASALVMKGKHAKLFRLADENLKVSLVNANDGWQVMVKMTLANNSTYEQVKDKNNYEPELSSVYGKLLSSSDVELESLDMDTENFRNLIAEDADEQAVVSGHTYSYHHFSYEEAKAMYDKTAAVELSGIELKKATVESSLSNLESVFDDDDLQDVKDAAKTANKILEAEKGILEALGDL